MAENNKRLQPTGKELIWLYNSEEKKEKKKEKKSRWRDKQVRSSLNLFFWSSASSKNDHSMDGSHIAGSSGISTLESGHNKYKKLT